MAGIMLDALENRVFIGIVVVVVVVVVELGSFRLPLPDTPLFPLLELELSVFRRIWPLIKSIMTPIRVLILEFSLSPEAS